MSDTVLVALISLVGTLGGTFGGILTSSKLTNFRIEQLEKKVEKHNNVIERMSELERKVDDNDRLYQEKFKTANHRIDDLAELHKPTK